MKRDASKSSGAKQPVGRQRTLGARIGPELDARIRRYFHGRKAVGEDLTIQDLVAEAVSEYLKKRGA